MKINHVYFIALMTLKMIWNVKTALCIIVFTPILINITFGYVAHKMPERMNTFIVIENSQQALWNSQMWQIADDVDSYRTKDGSQPFSVITKFNARGEAIQQLDLAETRAVIILSGNNVSLQSAEIVIDVTEPVVSGVFEQELTHVFERYSKEHISQSYHRVPDSATACASRNSEADGKPGCIPFRNHA